jgi:signal transduction histidine kinase/HAMP domain-containing protein
MKIVQKLLLILLGVSLLPLIGACLITLITTENALHNQIQVRIDNTAQHQLGRIEAINKNVNTQLNNIQFNAQLRILLHQYEQQPTPARQVSLRQALNDVLASQDTFHRVHIANPAGLVIASTDTSAIGQNYASAEVFATALKAPASNLFFKNSQGDIDQYLAVPLSLGDQNLGVAIVEATAAPYRAITKDYSELGLTGESYLVRPAAGKLQYLVPLRFQYTAALTASTRPAASLIDYRNHSVIVSTRAVPNTDWTLVVKIDAAEVEAPIIAARNLLILVLVLTALIATGAGWYSSHYITDPIRHFTEVVTKIRQGNLGLHVQVQTHDEIGLLGAAFNEMKTSLVETQARLEASLGSLPFGFAVINRRDEIVFFNQALSRLTGHPIPTDTAASSDTLKQINASYHDTIDLIDCLHQSQSSGQIIERNIEVGTHFYRLLFIPVINQVETTDDPVVGSVLVMEDTSEKKALERSRDEFFSIASHELRTPLTAIMGNASLMETLYAKLLDKDDNFKQMVLDIETSAERLIAIVNDFLDMSRLEQDRAVFKPAPFNLAQLVPEILREYNVAKSGSKLYFKFEPATEQLPPILADTDRVRQILVNLIANSVKSTTEGGITVTAQPVGKLMKVSVIDTGTGIPTPSQHLLFHKFQQTSESILTRDSSQSLGLGLYISRLMAEKMKGQLYLEASEVGQGSTFTLELPITDQPAEAKIRPRKELL